MVTLTVELPEEETTFFKEFLSKIHGKVISEDRVPNKETVRAMKELKEGKGLKFNTVDELFKSI
jgi:antitoxin component of RelBE/YafQ-DinJ toxin-antitoxin module